MSNKLFNTIEELKEFLKWAKTEGIQQVKVDSLEATFSAQEMGIQALKSHEEIINTPPEISPRIQNMIDESIQNEEEDLKFWSSN